MLVRILSELAAYILYPSVLKYEKSTFPNRSSQNVRIPFSFSTKAATYRASGFMLSFLVFTALLGLYLLYSACYRLYLSPLARILGPKLAALTLWYEFWYDVVKDDFVKQIALLHKTYGLSSMLYQ